MGQRARQIVDPAATVQSPNPDAVCEGNPRAPLFFVGEQDNPSSRPYDGEAGQLLARMIEAMGLRREDVYLCNLLRGHPNASVALQTQLDVASPKVIVALGDLASGALLGTSAADEPRGRLAPFRSAKWLRTFHPTELLKNPEYKREAWQHLQLVAKELGIALPAKR
ncbi:MAG: uracil-DNA glycosylase [Oligoflexia bacterium]|nr:uracil-DNA glycosylase [Oligoflexia bacterium]